METNQSVWSQWDDMKEEEKDYQYFKRIDEEKLQQTLEAIKREYIDNNHNL